jgi:hypothetical protein
MQAHKTVPEAECTWLDLECSRLDLPRHTYTHDGYILALPPRIQVATTLIIGPDRRIRE